MQYVEKSETSFNIRLNNQRKDNQRKDVTKPDTTLACGHFQGKKT